MIKKNVTYYEYKLLKAIYRNVKVMNAYGNSAAVVMGR